MTSETSSSNQTVPRISAIENQSFGGTRSMESGKPRRLELCVTELTTPTSKITLSTLIGSFHYDVRNQFFQGVTLANDFIRSNRAAYAAFKAAILCTAPHFVPIATLHGYINTDFCQDFEDGQDAHVTSIHAPSTLEDMRNRIRESRVSVHPVNVVEATKTKLITDLQGSWKNLVFECLERVRENTMMFLMQRIDAAICHQYEPVRAHTRTLIQKLIAKHCETITPLLCALLEGERTPSTLHLDDLEYLTAKWMSAVARSTHSNYTDYEVELELMAEVRAYFQIACKRFIDVVSGLIESMFVKGIIERDLLGFLQDGFGILE